MPLLEKSIVHVHVFFWFSWILKLSEKEKRRRKKNFSVYICQLWFTKSRLKQNSCPSHLSRMPSSACVQQVLLSFSLLAVIRWTESQQQVSSHPLFHLHPYIIYHFTLYFSFIRQIGIKACNQVENKPLNWGIYISHTDVWWWLRTDKHSLKELKYFVFKMTIPDYWAHIRWPYFVFDVF